MAGTASATTRNWPGRTSNSRPSPPRKVAGQRPEAAWPALAATVAGTGFPYTSNAYATQGVRITRLPSTARQGDASLREQGHGVEDRGQHHAIRTGQTHERHDHAEPCHPSPQTERHGQEPEREKEQRFHARGLLDQRVQQQPVGKEARRADPGVDP